MNALTQNTQAILLLTAPLIVGRSAEGNDLLTQTEYNRLARLLREKQRQPANLLGPEATELIRDLALHFGRERIESLLGRGFLLSQAVERWSARSIWVVSRADSSYPRRIKTRLKEDAPPVLYGCGDPYLLDRGGFAVVGSRHVDDELLEYSQKVGRTAADAGLTIVSGGAKGIDRAAMSGALQAGGSAAGVLADSLERAALARENREPLMDRKLVCISPYDPAAGFNVGHAMQRNKIIYALADGALVVNSDFGKGGTWAGAIEQLEKLQFVPLFVRNEEGAGKGNKALLAKGGVLWPEPHEGEKLREALAAAREVSLAAQLKQETMSFALREKGKQYLTAEELPSEAGAQHQDSASTQVAESNEEPADELFGVARQILMRNAQLGTENDIASRLGVCKPQMKQWLKQLLAEGTVEKVKKTKPVQYRIVAERLL